MKTVAVHIVSMLLLSQVIYSMEQRLNLYPYLQDVQTGYDKKSEQRTEDQEYNNSPTSYWNYLSLNPLTFHVPPNANQSLMHSLKRGVFNNLSTNSTELKLGLKSTALKNGEPAATAEWNHTKNIYAQLQHVVENPNTTAPVLSQCNIIYSAIDRSSKTTHAALNCIKEHTDDHQNESALAHGKQLLQNYPAMPWWILGTMVNYTQQKEQELYKRVVQKPSDVQDQDTSQHAKMPLTTLQEIQKKNK